MSDYISKFTYSGSSPSAPDPPQNIVLSIPDVDHVRVAWDASIGATSYTIYYSKDKAINRNVTIIAGITELFHDVDITASDHGTYYFAVTASN